MSVNTTYPHRVHACFKESSSYEEANQENDINQRVWTSQFSWST